MDTGRLGDIDAWGAARRDLAAALNAGSWAAAGGQAGRGPHQWGWQQGRRQGSGPHRGQSAMRRVVRTLLVYTLSSLWL